MRCFACQESVRNKAGLREHLKAHSACVDKIEAYDLERFEEAAGGPEGLYEASGAANRVLRSWLGKKGQQMWPNRENVW